MPETLRPTAKDTTNQGKPGEPCIKRQQLTIYNTTSGAGAAGFHKVYKPHHLPWHVGIVHTTEWVVLHNTA
jgi:hypothetical protein